ncbi:hypothetical protein [Bradyrhizobium sp. CSA207]|uniref:hypothetical protein n=1 Tax=Bradyrhizobium sp. CSA207 TaxID=2698826 RepID=UPI0031832AAF
MPDDWRSGVYALRLQPASGDLDGRSENYVTFFVTPGKRSRRAHIINGLTRT